MKTNKYIIMLFMLGLLVVSQSCSKDFLTEYPTAQQAPGDIQKMSDVAIVMNGAYDLMQNTGFLNRDFTARHDMRSDDHQVPHFGGSDYRVEGYWDEVTGGSWMDAQGNPACLIYAMRTGLMNQHVPSDNEVLYGKFDIYTGGNSLSAFCFGSCTSRDL